MCRFALIRSVSGMLVSCVLFVPSEASAQSSAPERVSSALASSIPDLPTLTSIAAAQAEGATFPKSAPDPLRMRLFSTYSGSPERVCTPVLPRIGAQRVGDFLIMFSPAPAGSRPKAWWVTAHDPTAQRNGLLVRGWRLRPDGPGPDSLRYASLRYTYQNAGRTPIAEFRPAHSGNAHLVEVDDSVIFPSAGDWMLVSTSGSDWSCLIVRIPPPSH